jgi:hypothetical protein
MFSYGMYRSTDNGASWQRIYTSKDPANVFGIRYEFATATLGTGKTRIYLADGRDEKFSGNGELVDASQLFRVDDGLTPASALTNEGARNNNGWTALSSPKASEPGFGSFDFCEAQCSYDMWVASPPGRPNTVWLGGSMQYGELSLYAGADRSDGRAVVRSTDGGLSWRDMTGDARTAFEDQHPDTRDVAFAPGNPNIAFIGSDGGVIRTSGTFSNVSAQCDTRGLSGNDLVRCHEWLSAVPTRLQPVNAGLATLQFQSLTPNPQNPLGDVIGGTQDNGTMGYTGTGTWKGFIGGDGGVAGIDAVDPNVRYHTYFNAQGDVNFHGNDPEGWDWYMDPLLYSGENQAFYVPFVADPKLGGSAYTGLEHVWRTQDSGGDPDFLDNHCYTNGGSRSDALFTGACGDWIRLGTPSLTGSFYGATRAGHWVAATARAASDDGTLWTSTRVGRVFITKNADATGSVSTFKDPFHAGVTLHSEDDVTFTRIDDGESASPKTPPRFVSAIAVDPADANHAWISYSGYSAYSPSQPGHVFEVHFNATTGTATWTDRSYDLGDQPVTGLAYDAKTGDLYASTDFGVARLAAGTSSWINAAAGLPPVAVYDLAITGGATAGARTLYAATHGRGAWRLSLP